jgi:hypothetical protein
MLERLVLETITVLTVANSLESGFECIALHLCTEVGIRVRASELAVVGLM